MKKLSIPFLVAFLILVVLFNFLTVFSTFGPTIVRACNNGGGDLRCEDIVGCTSSAGCGGPGKVTNCFLECSGGAVIACPDA